ncbi:ribosomal-protein-alanine N-acetyltransferase [compost metagenome]
MITNNLIIKPFSFEHLNEILSYQYELYTSNFKNHEALPSNDDVASFFINYSDQAFVLLEDNKIVGFYCYIDTIDIAILAQIFVVKNYRGKGYGKKLLNHFEKQLSHNNYKSYQLQASLMNTGAVELYKKIGCKVIETFEESGEVRYIMSKKI